MYHNHVVSDDEADQIDQAALVDLKKAMITVKGEKLIAVQLKTPREEWEKMRISLPVGTIITLDDDKDTKPLK